MVVLHEHRRREGGLVRGHRPANRSRPILRSWPVQSVSNPIGRDVASVKLSRRKRLGSLTTAFAVTRDLRSRRRLKSQLSNHLRQIPGGLWGASRSARFAFDPTLARRAAACSGHFLAAGAGHAEVCPGTRATPRGSHRGCEQESQDATLSRCEILPQIRSSHSCCLAGLDDLRRGSASPAGGARSRSRALANVAMVPGAPPLPICP